MIIDCHHHYIPEEIATGTYPRYKEVFWRGVPDHSVDGSFASARLWEIEGQLREMDAAGIDAAVLGCSAGLHATLEGARHINDRTAEIARVYPHRFIPLAVAPALDPGAPKELERAIGDMGFKGVFLPAQVERRTLDTRALWPFYEKVVELDVPILVHPSHCPPRFELIEDKYEEPPYYHRMFGREFDVVVEIVRLIYGGVLDDFPTLRVMMPHFGGGIAALAERINGVKGAMALPYRKNIDEYLPRFFFDTAGSFGGMNAVHCALTTLAPEQLCFGTDYPIVYRDQPEQLRAFIANLRALPLAPAQIEGIMAGNALRLFGRDPLPAAAAGTGDTQAAG